MVTWGQHLLDGYIEECALIGVILQPLTVSYSGTIATGSATVSATIGIGVTTATAPATTSQTGGGSSGSSGQLVPNTSNAGFSAPVGLGVVSILAFVFSLVI